jgi:hypothetical protein
MNSAILDVVEQYQAAFMDALLERFDHLSRDVMEEVWADVKKTKVRKTRRKKQTIPSAYVLFSREKRKSEALKQLDFGQISKQLGVMWRNATDDEKAPFIEESTRLRNEKTTTATPAATTADVQQEDPDATQMDNDMEKPIAEKPAKKAPRKKETTIIPEDMENEEEKAVWVELSKLKLAELRVQCTNSSIKPSKTREDMIRALCHYRMTLANHGRDNDAGSIDGSDGSEESEGEVEW